MTKPAAARSMEKDRRARTALRALIDEMMAQLRAASGRDEWTQEERAQAEADLARIMESVRREAMSQERRG